MLAALSPKARRNVFRILPFGIIWFAFSVVFLVVDYAAVSDQSNIPESAIRLDAGVFFFALLAVTAVGLLVGAIEVVYLHDRFAHRSLTQKLVYKTLFYVLLLSTAIVVAFPIAASLELDVSLWDARVWDKMGTFLASKTLLSTVLQLVTMLAGSLFYAEISEHIGHGVLVNFFTGRYHTPKEETRVFLFSDMKASTRIAEQLGHARYFELLRAYYRDLSEGIVAHRGEVYQYVGDEVIVSWPLARGVADNNCLACFFAMKRDLRARAAWYQKRFGVAPDFKAALHVGAVTTGEIGALKREIVFTGDVLNATARIQGLCHHYGVDLLISGDLLERLDPAALHEARALGRRTLRGRAREVELFTLDLHAAEAIAASP